MKKSFLTAVMAVVMILSCCTTVFAGWEADGAAFKYSDQYGNYVTGKIETIDGVKYGFDGAGHMIKGWAQFNDKWYFFDKTSGAMCTGWIQDGGKWYYMAPVTGAMTYGFITADNNKYCLGDDGVMKTGVFQYNNSYYKAGADGILVTNKLETGSDGRTLKYDETGAIWYKNEKSRSVNSAEWLPLTSDVKEKFDYDNYSNSVNDIMQTYYERYTSAMSSRKNSTARTEYRTQWEARVRKELTERDVPEDIINSYISDVEKNKYKDYSDYYKFSE